VVSVSTAETAEAVKITENVFRAVNIALVNELKIIYSRMGIDIFEVIEAAKTKPFGFMAFHPGPGLGGHCIPIDPFYLTWKAHEYGINTRFIELAGDTSLSRWQELWIITTVAVFRSHASLSSARRITRILMTCVKALRWFIMELLEARGAGVDYYDPLVPINTRT